MADNPFDILKISNKATIKEIQKAFRKLAFKYHPDTTLYTNSQNLFSKLYQSYQQALNYAKNKEQIKLKSISKQFKNYFGVNFFKIDNEESQFQLLILLFERIQDIIYKIKQFDFFRVLLEYLFSTLDKIEATNTKEYLSTIIQGLLVLISSRNKANTIITQEEFQLDIIRKDFCNYITDIFNSKNYLDLRMNINSPKEVLLDTIIDKLKNTKEEYYFMELSSLILIITLLGNNDFYNKWFELMQLKYN